MNPSTRSRNLWIVGIIAALMIFSALPLFGFGARMPGMMMWGWGFGGFGFLIRMLFWVALVGLIFGVFRRRRRDDDYYYGGYPPPRSDSSLEILRRRYAAGEITREQYEEMRQTLETTAHA